MTLHFQREISRLKSQLLKLSELVEEHVREAVEAVRLQDVVLARKVSDGDNRIDQAEIEVEEECLKILALYQPVAADLRFLVAALKINNDLERIGDLAVHVAHRALDLAEQTQGRPVEIPFDLEGMSSRVLGMLRRSIKALVDLDLAGAKEVCAADAEVDKINSATFASMRDELFAKGRPEALTLLFVSRHLERIADHTTNIAEDIIYMIEGRIVRHRVFSTTGTQ